jgi:hypothetical protein
VCADDDVARDVFSLSNDLVSVKLDIAEDLKRRFR